MAQLVVDAGDRLFSCDEFYLGVIILACREGGNRELQARAERILQIKLGEEDSGVRND